MFHGYQSQHQEVEVKKWKPWKTIDPYMPITLVKRVCKQLRVQAIVLYYFVLYCVLAYHLHASRTYPLSVISTQWCSQNRTFSSFTAELSCGFRINNNTTKLRIPPDRLTEEEVWRMMLKVLCRPIQVGLNIAFCCAVLVIKFWETESNRKKQKANSSTVQYTNKQEKNSNWPWYLRRTFRWLR